MEKDIKTFQLKINGEVVFEIEASGNQSVVAAFDKEVLSGTFGIFYNMKESMAKLIINEVELKMSTVFRDKKGKFVDIKKIVSTDKK